MLSDITIGAAAGGGAGFVSGFIASLVVLKAKDIRNDRLDRRGMPGYKDRVRSRLEFAFGVLGIAAGAGSAANHMSWKHAMIMPGVVPLIAGLLMVFFTLRQARR